MTHCRFRSPCHLSLLALLACAGLPLPVIAQQPANVSKSAAAVITARACRVQPGDAADIPSPERGPLLKLLVELHMWLTGGIFCITRSRHSDRMGEYCAVWMTW